MDRSTDASLAAANAGPPATEPRGWSWWRLAVVLAAGALSLALVTWLARRVEVPTPESQFDTRPLRRMQRLKPHVVLLGNSMVYTRFHEKTLNAALAPTRVMQIAYPGAATAVWYLALKNYVSGGRHRPKRVLLFFRHYELTTPTIRTTGRYARTLAKLSRGPEEVVERRLTPGTSNPIGRLGYAIQRFAPVQRLRPALTDVVQLWAATVSAGFVAEPDADARNQRVNDVFALSRLRTFAEPKSAESDVSDFEQAVEGSFLPDILALAREHGFALTFVRIRSRDSADGKPELPELLEYLSKVEAYVKAAGAGYVDMKDATWETADMYRDGDHLSSKHSATYSRLFAEHMVSLFR